MKNWGLLQNQQLAKRFYIFVGLVILYVFVNLTVLFGEDFFVTSNAFITPPVAVLTAFLFFVAASNPKDQVARPIWLGMGWGFGAWALAEVLWIVFPWLGIEIGAPSFVDLFWILGYIPLYYAFIYRLRSLHVSSTKTQKWMIAIATLLCLVVTYFLLLRPILIDFDPQRLWEWLTNLSYPLGDLVLLVLAVQTLFLLKDGRFSLSWRCIVFGTFLMAFSDLLYMYATWWEIYYPGGSLDLLSNVIDTTYTLAYAVIGFGVYAYLQIWQIKQQFHIRAETVSTNRYYAFVGTNNRDEIITASDNLPYLVNSSLDYDFYHMPLTEALGLDARTVATIHRRLASQQMITRESFTITTFNYRERKVWLTAVAILDPEKNYSGANIALSADVECPDDAFLPKNRELMGMLNYLMSIADPHHEDDILLIRGYFLDNMQLLSSMIVQFGGLAFKEGLFEKLNRVIIEQKLPVTLTEEAITYPEKCSEKDLARFVLPLIYAARQFVADLVGEEIVSEEIEEYHKSQPAFVLQKLDAFHMRDSLFSEKPASPEAA